jgi:hypothetical protein
VSWSPPDIFGVPPENFQLSKHNLDNETWVVAMKLVYFLASKNSILSKRGEQCFTAVTHYAISFSDLFFLWEIFKLFPTNTMKFILAFALVGALVNGECANEKIIDLGDGMKKLVFSGFQPDVAW